MPREAAQHHRFDAAQQPQREVTLAETLRAQEDARQYVGAQLATEREAMFAAAAQGKSTGVAEKAAKDVAAQEARLRERGSQPGVGGEVTEIGVYIADKLKMMGNNSRLLPTAKYDDYFNSVDFVLEWDVPTDKGAKDTVRLGIDVKEMIADAPNNEERKKTVLEGIQRAGPLRDLEYTVSSSTSAGQRQDQLSVPMVPVFIDRRVMQAFFADLVDPRTRELPAVLDPNVQPGLRQQFARNRFRGTLLNALRENIGTQIQELEHSKNTYKGNDFELRKIDRALYEIKTVRDIIDPQRKELGIGEVMPFRTREQQEQEAQEKGERAQMNKALDDQDKRLREFFKDVTSVFGVSPDEYIASRQAAATQNRGNALLEGSIDPAAYKKITKRLIKESPPARDDQTIKQIDILLDKSPLSAEQYLEGMITLHTYLSSHPGLQERDPKLHSRIEESVRKDTIAENLVDALRKHAETFKSAA